MHGSRKNYKEVAKLVNLLHENCFHLDKELNQSEIDCLLVQSTSYSPKALLEKGMQEQTLELIRSYLEENKWIFLSSNEIASKVNLSRITVRRYMNYLVENREIISQIDYSTGERLLFCKISEELKNMRLYKIYML